MPSNEPGQNYSPPGVYTQTKYENPIAGSVDAIKIPVFIGEGNEHLTQQNLEVVRGSSAIIVQPKFKEDTSGRAVAQITAEGRVVLGDWDGVRTRLQVRDLPIVKKDGRGIIATSRGDVTVTINGLPMVVLAVDGAKGLVTLAQPPKAGDDVRVNYYFNRMDTLTTEDLSEQVTPTNAVILAERGVADTDSPADDGEVVVLRADVLNPNGEVATPNNSTFSVRVDEVDYTTQLASGSYTMKQVANLINSSRLGSLKASTFINNHGHSALKLVADHSVEIQAGSGNSALGLSVGQKSERRRTFHTFHGPIVDGTNGGVTTTDPSKVIVKVDGVQAIPVSVDGATRAVTLGVAPKAGSKVEVTYWHNTWQDTFDYLAHNNVSEVTQLGEVPDSSTFTEAADYVLKNDKIIWGTSWDASAGVVSEGRESFDESKISGSLVDYRTYFSQCTPLVDTTTGMENKRRFRLPLSPTLGNGRDTPLGQNIFQTASNGRIDLPANRPDVVTAYWGYGIQDAMDRGPIKVLRVEGNVIDLAESVPTGADVYATFYYNLLTDGQYTLSATLPGPSGQGKYTISDDVGRHVLGVTQPAGSKGASLTGVTVEWPSGSELTPDLRLEGGSGPLFQGPTEEIVTVQFAEREATPARMSMPGSGPYHFIKDESDHVRVKVDGSDLSAGVGGIDLRNPSTYGNYPAILVGEEIVYTGGEGAEVGKTYTLPTDEDAVFYIDGVEVPVVFPAAEDITVSPLAGSINEAAQGFAATAVGGGDDTITLHATHPGRDVDHYYVGWLVVIGDGADAATPGQVMEITAYNSSTGVATVEGDWAGGAVVAGDPYRVYNPATMAAYKGSTRFDGPVTLTGFSSIRFNYTGSTSGAYTTDDITIAEGPHDSAAALASVVAAALNGVDGFGGAGDEFAGAEFAVTADAEGRLVFKCQAAGVDSDAFITFLNVDDGEADSFAALAGMSTGAAVGGGQAHLNIAGDVSKSFVFIHDDSGFRPHNRLFLRNRVVPGVSDLWQVELRVGAGSVLDRLGLEAGDFGLAGRPVIEPASIRGRLTFAQGQDEDSSEPLVTFYDGTGGQAANNVLDLVIDGQPVSVTFEASPDGTPTKLGPASGESNGSTLDQILDAIGSVPGLPFGDEEAAYAAGMVARYGAGFELRSVLSNLNSLVEVSGGSAVSVLGLREGEVAQRVIPAPETLASALNSNRHATFSTWMLDFSAENAAMFAGVAVASIVEDSAGAKYLSIQSKTVGTSSSVQLKDPTVASLVTDSWLYPGTRIGGVDGMIEVGEAAIDGFFVTSNKAQGSGSANDSILNDGVGADGVVGQTYRDAVTGLTFTILPRGYHDNPTGPWLAYPTGGKATLRFQVSKTFTADANIPHNAILGLELVVANTTNLAVGDTSIVETFERGGREPLVGDVYYVSYRYRKDDYSTKFFTKLSAIEAEYGPIHPDNPVSLAAYLATLNGAVLIGIKQVPREDGEVYGSIEKYRDAITELEGVLPNQVRPDIIIPLRGDSLELFQLLGRSNRIQSSVRYRSERTSIIGLSAGKLPQDAINVAQSLSNERMRLVYPDMALVQLQDAFGNSQEHLVDGPMIAAALAGSIVSPTTDVATPWTNRNLVGFSQLARRLDAVEMNRVANYGVTVLEERPPFIRVRHGLTTNLATKLTKLPTICLIADEVQRQARAVLRRYVGIKYLPGVLTQIEGRLAMMLKQLVSQQIITAYTGVKASVDPNDPTTCVVEAYYSPVFPLEYINVTFHLRSSL